MSSRIRLIAIDIDGTLLNSKNELSAANLAALRRAHEDGIEVVLGTGRRHAFAMPIAEALGFDLWMISSNGAVTRSTKDEHFFIDFLPANVCRDLCVYMGDEFRANTVITFERPGKGALIVERTDELTESIQRWIEKNSQFIEFVVPIESAIDTNPIQAMFCGRIPKMELAQAKLFAWKGREHITVLKTQYDHRDLCIVDILNRDCSKGHALERFATARGISRDEIVAIGDNYNDIEMLRIAGHPFIMGNASNELKQNGWPVTLTNDESGVAAAIEQVLAVNA
ncbi:MAG TPA: Cof-type HAD-IIB family hydrolase [Candidatus Koribacter sp.]